MSFYRIVHKFYPYRIIFIFFILKSRLHAKILNFQREAVCSSSNTKSWLLYFPQLIRSSRALLLLEDSWIFNFSIAGGWYYLALAMSPPGRTEAVGSKNEQGCYASRSYWSGQTEKCTKLYSIIKRAKKMCSGKAKMWC
jgi:hypothetical protein